MITRARFLNCMPLARQKPRPSRLIVDCLGAGIKSLPCEILLLAGRDVDDWYDRAYGAWVARAYERKLARQQPTLQAVRARGETSPGRSVEGRYDRLLLPWRGARGERFVMCMFQTRAYRVLSHGAQLGQRPAP